MLYIFIFGLKMVTIRNRRLSELIGLPCSPALSSFGQYAQYGFYALYKASAPDPS